MANHTFQFTLSGAELTEEQKLRISNDIALVVTKAVVGDSPDLLSAPVWNLCRINGGKIFIADAASEVLNLVENSADTVLTAGINPAGAALAAEE